MKKNLFTLTLLMAIITANAQKNEKFTKTLDSSLTERFTFISPKRDTLYIANNRMGILTKWIWDNDKNVKVKKPYIIIVSEKQLFTIISFREKKPIIKNFNKKSLTVYVKD